MAITKFPHPQLIPKKPIENMSVSCVYRIWLGKKYYIGKTKDLENRIRCHEYDLRRHIKNTAFGKVNMFYQHMVDHVIKHKINTCYFEILGICRDEDARVRLEQMWFDTCCDDINCLNYGFQSYAYIPPHNPKPKKEKPVRPSRTIGIKKPKPEPQPKKIISYAQQIKLLKKKLANIK